METLPVAASTLYEKNNTGTGNNHYDVWGTRWYAETFTTGSSPHSITTFKFYGAKDGSPAGPVIVHIRAASGNLPTGADLTTGSIACSSIGAAAWYSVSITTYNLAINTQYAVVISCAGTAGNHINWFSWNNNPYSGGRVSISADSGSSWSGDNANDFLFEIWGDPTNNIPINDGLTLDLTGASYKNIKTLLCAKQDYKFVHQCTDLDGVMDITYVEIRLDSSSKNVILRATRGAGDSWTFGEQSDPSNYVVLNVTACTDSTSGNQKTFNYYVTINWAWGDSTETLSVLAYIIDSQSDSDTDTYTNIFGVEAHLASSSLAVDYYIVNPSQTLTMSGYWYYDATSIYPPDNNYHVNVTLDEVQKGSTDTTLVSGAFSINDVTAEAVLGNYTYSCSATHMASADSFSTVTVERMMVMGYSGLFYASGSSTLLDINVTLRYDYFGTLVTTGTMKINGTSASNLGSGIYRATINASAILGITYNNVSGSESGYGLDTVNQNGRTLTLAWDSIFTPAPIDPVSRFSSTFRVLNNTAYSIDGSIALDPDGGSILNWTWDFDDGNVTSGNYPAVIHTWTATGTYIINLTVTDDEVATDSFQFIVIVYQPTAGGGGVVDPVARCGGNFLAYANESYVIDGSGSLDPDGGTIDNYSWDFDDGNVTAGAGYDIAHHTWIAVGNYSLSLTVTDDEAATDVYTIIVSVVAYSAGGGNAFPPVLVLLFISVPIVLVLLLILFDKKRR